MCEYIQNGTSLYKKVEPNKRVDYKADIDEFEFKRTPETDTMLKQLCVKEKVEVVRCKDCKYSVDNDYCLFSTADMGEINKMDADDFCSRGERRDE